MQSKMRFLIAVVLTIIVAVAAGYAVLYYSQEPNIQTTQVQINPYDDSQSSVVANYGTVHSGPFNYTATQPGSYAVVFSNSLSIFSSKQVSVAFTVAGQAGSQSFQLSPGQERSINASLQTGQQFSGTFTISGGSGNDLDLYVQQNTCNEIVSYAFTLVNGGVANGFATVGIQSGGQVFQLNKYYVTAGQQLPENGQVTLPGCNNQPLSIVVIQQDKA